MAAAEDEPPEKAAAVMQQAECGDTQILICYDGPKDAERAVDTAAALLGPRRAVVLAVAPYALRRAEAGAVYARRGLREFARGSVSHDVASHARRAVLMVPPVTT